MLPLFHGFSTPSLEWAHLETQPAALHGEIRFDFVDFRASEKIPQSVYSVSEQADLTQALKYDLPIGLPRSSSSAPSRAN